MTKTTPAIDLSRPFVHLALGVSEGFAGVADRRSRPVGHDDSDERCTLTAIAPVDILNDLLTPAALDIDVDVRRAVALWR